MKRRHFARAGLAALLCASVSATGVAAPQCGDTTCGGELIFVGTHGSGPGQGIFSVRLDPRSGALSGLKLAAEIERPTWLVRDPARPVIFAVSETGNDGKSQGGVFALAIDRKAGTLKVLGRSDSGGGGATHLTLDPRSNTIFVANYGTGQVSAIPVDKAGRPTGVSSVQQNSGSGPSPRQKSPHAHGVTLDPTGRYVLSPDLGADKVFVFRFDPATRTLAPAAEPFVGFTPGSGPRHLVFAQGGRFAFVNTELTGEVYGFRWDSAAGRLTAAGHILLDAPDFAGTRSAAELAVSRDGRFLYASNRGANLMQVFAIDQASGALSEVQRIDCGGQVPWSFGIDPAGRWLIVTNEASSSLSVFAVDRASGRLSATGAPLPVPKPVAVAFAR